MMMFSDIACFLSPDTTICRQTWRCRAAEDAQLSPHRVTGSRAALSHREQGRTAMARQAGEGGEQAGKAAVRSRSRSSTAPVALQPHRGSGHCFVPQGLCSKGRVGLGAGATAPGQIPELREGE